MQLYKEKKILKLAENGRLSSDFRAWSDRKVHYKTDLGFNYNGIYILGTLDFI